MRSNKFLVVSIVALIILPIGMIGCRSRSESTPEEMKTEISEPALTQEADVTQVTEPAQNMGVESIPPTAAPQSPVAVPQAITPEQVSRSKDIQKALKNAGFYTGAIDGKIGPRTKKAIEEFQKAHGLNVDGKVGPKTWAELKKFLIQQ